jgi:hypothetical protein
MAIRTIIFAAYVSSVTIGAGTAAGYGAIAAFLHAINASVAYKAGVTACISAPVTATCARKVVI